MAFDYENVGRQIASLRKSKGLTQAELGDRLCISPQAVSKWERGESMPDISLLPDLAAVLETTTDNILSGGSKMIAYGRKITVKDAKEALECFERIGELLGKDSTFYMGAIEGIDRKMNVEFEEYMKAPFTRDAMVAEAIIQCIRCGAYVDMSDIKREFTSEHWISVIEDQARKYGVI